MGEMQDSVDSVMQMMGELSKQQPLTMRYFKAFIGEVLKKGYLIQKQKNLLLLVLE